MVWILMFSPPHIMFYLTCIFERSKLLKALHLCSLCPKTKCIVFGAPYERGSPDRGDCLYIRLSPALCFLLKHCPHISNYVLAVTYTHNPSRNNSYFPIYNRIKAFHCLAINFSFTTCASDGGQICNKMELDDLIFHLGLGLLVVEQLFFYSCTSH